MTDPVEIALFKRLASALLICLEGSRLKAYRARGDVWTVGIGHTKGVTEGMLITPAQEVAFLEEDQAPLYSLVLDKPILEAVADLDFGFNCGKGALEKILDGKDTISNPAHTHSGVGVLDGLIARRNLELALIAVSEYLAQRK